MPHPYHDLVVEARIACDLFVVEPVLHDPPALVEDLRPLLPLVHLHREGEIHLRLPVLTRHLHLVDVRVVEDSAVDEALVEVDPSEVGATLFVDIREGGPMNEIGL